MQLEKLQLLNFKNYEEATLQFASGVNVLVGKNGSGKTNILDAIYYLSLTKSAFASSDHQCVRHQQNYFMIKGWFDFRSKKQEVLSSLQVGSKKVFKEDQVEYAKLSEHIGKYPVVLIAPDDVDLVKEGSEERRKFFDSIIAQLDKKYLEALMIYNHSLKQRNSLLKMFQERGKPDWAALESYDEVLCKTGKFIFLERKKFIENFLPVFKHYYRFIVNEQEDTDLLYVSELKEMPYEEGLRKVRQKDIILQRTNFGIHRDDYQFTLSSDELKRFGSQGQQKSFVIALKLAQFAIIEKHKGFKPILLLDDIFDKLDDFRITKLLELIKEQFGQLFISDARPDRTRGLLEQIGVSASMFHIENGVINTVSLRRS